VKIKTGLLDHMVLQRDRKNQSDCTINGTSTDTGPVQLRVTHNGKTVRGFSWKATGKAQRGKFTAKLKGLPTGGPYDIQLRVDGSKKSLTVRDILVGDVWILGGQSNMQGVGDREHRLKPNPSVRAFYFEDRWAPAKDPIHNLWDSPDPVHNVKTGSDIKPVGPGVAMGQALFASTGVPQGLIANAHGGTSMSQWDPKLKNKGGESLYGSLIRRLKLLDTKVSGIAWYQGESDAGFDVAPYYLERMKKLIRAIRRDTGDPNLPFAVVQLARYFGNGFDPNSWNLIQDCQRQLFRKVKNVAVVPAIDLPMDDHIHISGDGANVLGQRLAHALRVLRGGRKVGKPSIDLKSVKIVKDKLTGQGNIEVRFDNLEQGLAHDSLPSGFSLIDQSPITGIFDTRVYKDRVVLRTDRAISQLPNLAIQYGHGPTPVCTLMDESGRPVPVFGPIPLGKHVPSTPFVTQLRVSSVLPAAGNLSKFKLPTPRQMKWKKRRFNHPVKGFLEVREELTKGDGDGVICFAYQFQCDEAMKLQLEFGYDGPIKVWLNKKQVCHDPKGTNPAVPGEKLVPINAKRGKHEVIVALSNANNTAWGMFLRIGRKDLSKKIIEAGQHAWKLPKIL